MWGPSGWTDQPGISGIWLHRDLAAVVDNVLQTMPDPNHRVAGDDRRLEPAGDELGFEPLAIGRLDVQSNLEIAAHCQKKETQIYPSLPSIGAPHAS